jgi:hypothetical protein
MGTPTAVPTACTALSRSPCCISFSQDFTIRVALDVMNQLQAHVLKQNANLKNTDGFHAHRSQALEAHLFITTMAPDFVVSVSLDWMCLNVS